MTLDFIREICKIVFAATDENRGCIAMGTKLHPKTKIEGGLLAEEAASLMQDFLEIDDKYCKRREIKKATLNLAWLLQFLYVI